MFQKRIAHLCILTAGILAVPAATFAGTVSTALPSRSWAKATGADHLARPHLLRCLPADRRLLAQESEFVQEYCALCAEVCHLLREECLKQPSLSHCQRCGETALSCDQACQKAAV